MASGAITVIGTGNWGTTLAVMLARTGRPVILLARDEAVATDLQTARMNRQYLPGVEFPPALQVVGVPHRSLPAAVLVLLAVPSQTMRANALAISHLLPADSVILSCAKGLERGTLLRMSAVLQAVLPSALSGQVGVLSGPNIAHEIVLGQPATSVVATIEPAAAQVAQGLLNIPLFRVYTTHDVIGVELGGALKNIIALGAGICDGMQTGDNAKAAFMTRGLAEISRLGVAMGANPLTFAGLAGLGDLVATCASPHSRNRRLGMALAQGQSLATAQAGLGQVAEGVTTVQAARALARTYNVEMPITEQLYSVLFAGKNPQAAIRDLLQRGVKHELA